MALLALEQKAFKGKVKNLKIKVGAKGTRFSFPHLADIHAFATKTNSYHKITRSLRKF